MTIRPTPDNSYGYGTSHLEILTQQRETSMSRTSRSSRTIVITGGLGNLGSKLCRHLIALNDIYSSSSSSSSSTSTSTTKCIYKVVLVEHPDFIHRHSTQNNNNSLPHDEDNTDVTILPCDLGNLSDEQSASLRGALQDADTLVHFSAVNPYPNATWSDSAQSMDHTFNIFQLAVICKGECVTIVSGLPEYNSAS